MARSLGLLLPQLTDGLGVFGAGRDDLFLSLLRVETPLTTEARPATASPADRPCRRRKSLVLT